LQDRPSLWKWKWEFLLFWSLGTHATFMLGYNLIKQLYLHHYKSLICIVLNEYFSIQTIPQ
jgi:hypothetical protein